MKFVVTRNDATRLWHWELRAVEGGSIAKGGTGFCTLEQLFTSIHAIRTKAPQSLVFDVLGTLCQDGFSS